MNKYIKYAFALTLPTLAFTACDDFLDTMPDNRATVDTEDKIKSLLVSAYFDHDYCYVAELLSDNTDNYGDNNPYTTRWLDDTYNFKDESETDNESMNSFWESAYTAIASANEALKAIDELGGPDKTANLSAMRGEALLCRAYSHFMLANLFCNHWTTNAANDLGLPYMEEPETELMPKYERGNLAELYTKIETDLEEGLERVSDSYYSVPKYHFNTKAAYAFANRFYVYTEQWEKAIRAADRCLGSQPQTMLRDWAAIAAMPANQTAQANEYINASSNANLLLMTAYSALGLSYGAYYTNSKYSHGAYIASNEDVRATNIWGGYSQFRVAPRVYSGTNLDKVIIWKCPYLFEYTDIVAQTGYRHTVYPAFTTDEVLLNRAEAYIMLNRFDEAAADLTMWMQNVTKSTMTLTPASITTFYNSCDYSYNDGLSSTIKKHLNPAFAIAAEGSTQECMLQCMLGFRRMETLHHGLRWFDIKRYGIEYPRRLMNASGLPALATDFIGKDDLRRVVQIPQKVRDAEFTPNPRKDEVKN